MGTPTSGGLNDGILGAPRPGFVGLEPDAANRRVADCIIRGGDAESCNSLRKPTPPVAADCTKAETHWKSVEEIRTLAAYQDHLARFGKCEFATLAAARIQALKH